MTFEDLGVSAAITGALREQRIVTPTDIQAAVLPLAFQGKSLLAQSSTGTGKTLAFLIPILQSIDARTAHPRALVVSPTRELASQSQRVCDRLVEGAALGIKSSLLIGGASPLRQAKDLRGASQIVFGTTGRILEMAGAGQLKLGGIKTLVLDEADRLFSREMVKETEALFAALPALESVQGYSATIGKAVTDYFAGRFPGVEIINLESEILTGDIEHWCFLAERRKKLELIKKLDLALKPKSALLFGRDTGSVLNAVERLGSWGIPVTAIHGDFDSVKRLESLDRFRRGQARWLVTSDVSARGLDVPEVDYVLMLETPADAVSYIHRAGRTGRNGAKGVCVSIVDPHELKIMSRIAVSLGFNFKVKRLYAGEVIDITLDEFFAEAQKMSVWRVPKAKRPIDKP